MLSRQVRRKALFDRNFAEITRRFGGESRKIRRSIARALTHKAWRDKESESSSGGGDSG
jgi:ribosomal protein L29